MTQVRESQVRVVVKVKKSSGSPVQLFAGLGLNKKAAELAAAKCALKRLTAHNPVYNMAA